MACAVHAVSIKASTIEPVYLPGPKKVSTTATSGPNCNNLPSSEKSHIRLNFPQLMGIRIATGMKRMVPLTAGWVAQDADLQYDVMQTDMGWMLILKDGPVTLTQVFDSAPAAEAEAQAIALLLTPVDSRPH